MANLAPATVEEYLDSLPEDRRASIEAVRNVILANLQPGFQEGIAYGMIGYCVPHSVYPKGYHCNPKQALPFAGLGNQKNYISLHLMFVYMNEPLQEWLQAEYAKSGKKLDMGKGCLRFKKSDDVALDVIGRLFAKVTVDGYIGAIESAVASRK